MSDLKILEKFFKTYSELDDQLDFKVAKEMYNQKLDVISTGSHLLNDALSSGGIPLGRIVQFYGRAGSGKTLMSMLAIKQAQQKNPEAMQCFIDAEGTFSSDWAETLGINTEKVILIENDLAVNGRRLFECLLGVPKEDKQHKLAGKSKEGLLDKIIKKELDINLFILDSLGAIIPPGEDTSAVGKQNISLLARFLSTTLKKLSLEVKKANVAFIIINHAKDNMDPYGQDHTFSGGNSYNHSLSANIWFQAVSRKDGQLLNEKEEKIGNVIKAKVEKSKFGPHPRDCEFKVDFSKGIIDLNEEIVELAIKYDIITRPNNVTYMYKDQSWRGAEAVNVALLDVTLAEEILKQIETAQENKRLNKKVDKTSDADDIDTSEEDVDDILSSVKKRGRKPKDE